MKRASFLISVTLLLSTVVYGQAPAAAPSTPSAAPNKPAVPAPAQAASGVVPAGGKSFAVIEFMSALTGNTEGKKVTEKLSAETAKREGLYQAKQKEGSDIQAKLATDKTLTDVQKATMGKQLEQVSTDLTRMKEDFQNEITEMQTQLLTPIADKLKKEITAYATENGFALVLDSSGQTDNIIYVDPVADITTEIIRRMDAAALKAPAPPAGIARPSNATPSARPPIGTPSAPPRSPAPATTKAPPDATR